MLLMDRSCKVDPPDSFHVYPFNFRVSRTERGACFYRERAYVSCIRAHSEKIHEYVVLRIAYTLALKSGVQHISQMQLWNCPGICGGEQPVSGKGAEPRNSRM
jgi:hypothetical protein